MKKLLSAFLILTLIICSVPLCPVANAEDTDFSYSFLTDEVYYTDLFSVYSQYLLDDGLTDTMDEEIQTALITVYKNLCYSEKYYDIVNKHVLTNISDVTSLLKLISDATGDTDFTYQEALDTANELLVVSMFEKNYVIDHVNYNDRSSKAISVCKEIICMVLEDAVEIHKYEINNISLEDILVTVLSNEGKYYNYFSSYYAKDGVKQVVDYCYANVEVVSGIFEAGTTAIEMFSAIMLAFTMEMMRTEIINDLIDVAEEGSALYDGMTKLAGQLVGGAASYFIETYIKGEAIKKFEDTANDFVTDVVIGNNAPNALLVINIVEISAKIAYDLILKVPDFSELTAYIILSRYSDELSDCIKKMEQGFTNTALNGHSITQYENLWYVYNAANKAAWKLGNELAIEKDKNTLDFAFTMYYCSGFDFYNEKMDFVMKQVEKIPVEERNVVSPSAYKYNYNYIDGKFALPTNDSVEDGYIYTVNGYVYGDLYSRFDCDLSFLGDVEGIYGSVEIDGETLEVPKDSEYTVVGDLLVTGYWSGGYDHEGVLNNQGKLSVYGDVYTDVDYTQYGFSMGSNAELWLYGDFSLPWFTNYGGTVICNGSETQHLYGEFKNLKVYNPAGIDGSIDLYGHFDLGSNPFFGTVNLFDGGSFEEGSNYRDVQVKENCTMRSSIPADNVTVYGVKLTVPAGGDYTIDGNVILGGYISGSTTKKGTLAVEGALTVTGDVSRMNDTNTYYEFLMSGSDSFFEIKGDQNVGIAYGSGGTVLFSGAQKQKACGNYNNIFVMNPEGITGDIVLSGHFDLNGNPYDGKVTLKGGTFADGSNYNEVYIESDQTLRSNIPADKVEIYRATLTVPEGADYKIDGDIYLGGYMYGHYSYYGILDVRGALTVGGDISNIEGNNYYKINTYSGSVIRFAGEDGQSVKGIYNVYTLIIDNASEEGVSFSSGINAMTLFDHNRNNYSFNGTVNFADYDGDGLLDNEDPVPEAAVGDVNMDRSLNSLDANALARFISGADSGEYAEEKAILSDLNGDGSSNAIDSNIMKRRMAGV